jgi:hypothetical protein
VAERVEVHGDARQDAEHRGEVRAAGEDLPHERFAARQIAVGLEVPAAHDVPAPGAHELPDAVEQRRIVRLDPPVEHRLVVAEDEPVEFGAQIRRRPEGRERGGQSFFPRPQPHGVDVRVADQHERCAIRHESALTVPVTIISPDEYGTTNS